MSRLAKPFRRRADLVPVVIGVIGLPLMTWSLSRSFLQSSAPALRAVGGSQARALNNPARFGRGQAEGTSARCPVYSKRRLRPA